MSEIVKGKQSVRKNWTKSLLKSGGLPFCWQNIHQSDLLNMISNGIMKKVADKLIVTELLGLDINGQWYDSIKNGGKPIKNLFTKNERESNNEMS